MKCDMQRIYESIFHGTPAMDMTLFVDHTNIESNKREIARARPHKSVLKPMHDTSKT